MMMVVVSRSARASSIFVCFDASSCDWRGRRTCCSFSHHSRRWVPVAGAPSHRWWRPTSARHASYVEGYEGEAFGRAKSGQRTPSLPSRGGAGEGEGAVSDYACALPSPFARSMAHCGHSCRPPTCQLFGLPPSLSPHHETGIHIMVLHVQCRRPFSLRPHYIPLPGSFTCNQTPN